MKKTLIFIATLLLAITTNAATINWSIGGALNASANVNPQTDTGSFILAYIGATYGIGVDAATFATEIAKGEGVSSYSIVDTGKWGDFYRSNRDTYAKTKPADVPDVKGATYQAFYVKDGSYFLVNDPTIATVAIAIDGAGAASTTAYLNGEAQSGGSLYAAGSASTAITSVPEPSVALMGLLGLGMLLKRRRA